jgi:hypothetical protein
VHQAQPIRQFAPVQVLQSNKKLTEPESPMLKDKRRRLGLPLGDVPPSVMGDNYNPQFHSTDHLQQNKARQQQQQEQDQLHQRIGGLVKPAGIDEGCQTINDIEFEDSMEYSGGFGAQDYHEDQEMDSETVGFVAPASGSKTAAPFAMPDKTIQPRRSFWDSWGPSDIVDEDGDVFVDRPMRQQQ